MFIHTRARARSTVVAVALLGLLTASCDVHTPVGPGTLSTITVTPNTTMTVGETQQFVAVGRDADGDIVPIDPVWSVAAGGGTIHTTGLFTGGMVPGTYLGTVTATSGGISGNATVILVAGPAVTLVVTPDPATMAINAVQQFTATARDFAGNVVAVSPVWSIVNGGGAINAAGAFTAGTVLGTFTNTVRATAGSLTANATAIVTAGPLAAMTIVPNPATLVPSATQQFTVAGTDAGGNTVFVSPTWSVINGGGAISATTGLFTAGSTTGTFTNTVLATSGGVTATATVIVTPGALATITVTPNPASLVIGAVQEFTAVGRDAAQNIVPISPTWSVINGGGSINSTSGLFTAGQVAGTFSSTVVASIGSLSGTATVTVTAGALASMTITPNPASLGIGTAQQFTVIGRDIAQNIVPVTPTWSVVNGGGTINSTGVFTAGLVIGSYPNTVRASSGSLSATATVNVTAGPLATITVTPNPASMAVGGTQLFTAVGRDASQNIVAITPTWSVVNGGGSINSSSGVFVAGQSVGSFANTVTATAGTITGTASVTVTGGALASITVTPNPVSLGLGATQLFTAVGRDAQSNIVPITPTWSVVNGGGSINGSTGQFTAGQSVGTFTNTVVATSGAISGSATVSVTPGPVVSIIVSPNPASLAIGGVQQFTASGRDAANNIVPVTVTWSVINGGGVINATSGAFTAGSTTGSFNNTVVATAGLVSGTATVNVTPGPLASITVTPDPLSLNIGGQQTFSAVGRDAAQNIVAITPTWSVVNGGGLINGTTGLFTAGQVTGTYTNTVVATAGAISGSATVTVTPGALATITVTPNPVSLVIGGAQQFTAVGRDAANNIVSIVPTWSVVNGGGTINGTGAFTAGTVTGSFANTVRASSGLISGTATVTVTPGPLASILVTPNPASLVIGGQQQFTAVGRDASLNIVPITPVWSVVNGGGLINGATGLFTAGLVSGSYTNTVVATAGAISGSATVTVTPGALATITVTPNPASLAIGGLQQFTAVGRDASLNIVAITPVWSVVNGGGTINGTGAFTAGTVTGSYLNTVRAESGAISGTATVTVTPGPLATILVTPNPASMSISGQQQFTAVGRDASLNIVPITPVWSVVNGGGGINSGTGLFTAGLTAGTFESTVVATSGAISGSATVTVTPGPLATILVTPNPASMSIGGQQQFTAVGRDASLNIVPITAVWSVVNGGGLINSASGLFTAGLLSGTFSNTVVATSGAISGTATVNITAGPLASITVTPDPASMVIGGQQQFTAVGRDASLNVVPVTPVWSVVSGGGSIDDVTGFFTAGVVAGTFTNTVVATSGLISGTATVEVTPGPLAAITVTPNPASVMIGAQQQFTAVGRDASLNIVPITPTWSVVNGGGAIDGGTGMFTAGLLAGTFNNTVVATAGAISGTATVTVTPGPLATITVSPNPGIVTVATEQQFLAVGRDASLNIVPITPVWSVANGGGLINSSSGMFTAGLVLGTFNNTVVATSGLITGSATVEVTAGPLASIEVTPNPASLTIGAQQQFTAVGRDALLNIVPVTPTWSVENGGGTINGISGMFTAGMQVGPYTNTVRATSGMIQGSATVNVTPGVLASLDVSPDPVTLGAGDLQQFVAVGRDAGNNIVPVTPSWSVVNGGGTINNLSGVFTAGVGAGTFIGTVRADVGMLSDVATVTVTADPPPPPLVPLGDAAPNGIIAGESVTCVTGGLIQADVSISPGNTITGFGPCVITGVQHLADGPALAAQTALTTAYNTLAGLPCPPANAIVANLGGTTKAAGVYCTASSIGVTGTLTLDGGGDPNANFVFQAGTSLITAGDIVLINGAQAKNVYWQVGSSATLGTASQWKGNILALTSITLVDNAVLLGRALARNGSVTLGTNNVIILP